MMGSIYSTLSQVIRPMPSLVDCWVAAILRRQYQRRFLPKQVLRRGARQLEREFGPMQSGHTAQRLPEIRVSNELHH